MPSFLPIFVFPRLPRASSKKVLVSLSSQICYLLFQSVLVSNGLWSYVLKTPAKSQAETTESVRDGSLPSLTAVGLPFDNHALRNRRLQRQSRKASANRPHARRRQVAMHLHRCLADRHTVVRHLFFCAFRICPHSRCQGNCRYWQWIDISRQGGRIERASFLRRIGMLFYGCASQHQTAGA